jgi:hypothetical protein
MHTWFDSNGLMIAVICLNSTAIVITSFSNKCVLIVNFHLAYQTSGLTFKSDVAMWILPLTLPRQSRAIGDDSCLNGITLNK